MLCERDIFYRKNLAAAQHLSMETKQEEDLREGPEKIRNLGDKPVSSLTAGEKEKSAVKRF